MKEGQIETYEYCKKHLEEIKKWREQLPFGIQLYGCGSRRPSIEHSLDSVHRTMFEKVREAMNEAESNIKNVIKEL